MKKVKTRKRHLSEEFQTFLEILTIICGIYCVGTEDVWMCVSMLIAFLTSIHIIRKYGVTE